MTTSEETDGLDHPVLRELVRRVADLPLAERVTLLKGLVPMVARDLAPRDFDRLVLELGLKGERFYEARGHPGQGRSSRHVIGERDYEGR